MKLEIYGMRMDDFQLSFPNMSVSFRCIFSSKIILIY